MTYAVPIKLQFDTYMSLVAILPTHAMPIRVKSMDPMNTQSNGTGWPSGAATITNNSQSASTLEQKHRMSSSSETLAEELYMNMDNVRGSVVEIIPRLDSTPVSRLSLNEAQNAAQIYNAMRPTALDIQNAVNNRISRCSDTKPSWNDEKSPYSERTVFIPKKEVTFGKMTIMPSSEKSVPRTTIAHKPSFSSLIFTTKLQWFMLFACCALTFCCGVLYGLHLESKHAQAQLDKYITTINMLEDQLLAKRIIIEPQLNVILPDQNALTDTMVNAIKTWSDSERSSSSTTSAPTTTTTTTTTTKKPKKSRKSQKKTTTEHGVVDEAANTTPSTIVDSSSEFVPRRSPRIAAKQAAAREAARIAAENAAKEEETMKLAKADAKKSDSELSTASVVINLNQNNQDLDQDSTTLPPQTSSEEQATTIKTPTMPVYDRNNRSDTNNNPYHGHNILKRSSTTPNTNDEEVASSTPAIRPSRRRYPLFYPTTLPSANPTPKSYWLTPPKTMTIPMSAPTTVRPLNIVAHTLYDGPAVRSFPTTTPKDLSNLEGTPMPTVERGAHPIAVDGINTIPTTSGEEYNPFQDKVGSDMNIEQSDVEFVF